MHDQWSLLDLPRFSVALPNSKDAAVAETTGQANGHSPGSFSLEVEAFELAAEPERSHALGSWDYPKKERSVIHCN